MANAFDVNPLRIALLAAAAALHFGCTEAMEACDLGARLVREAPRAASP